MPDNVTPLKRSYPLKMSPTNGKVLKLLTLSNSQAGDPVQAYGDLMAAALLAARFLNLDPLVIGQHIAAFTPRADAAIRARPDIFGGQANDR